MPRLRQINKTPTISAVPRQAQDKPFDRCIRKILLDFLRVLATLDSGNLRRFALQAVLTIAGSDPSGGAGIQADLKTFAGFGVYGMSVVTAVTAQNSLGVQGVFDVPPEFVARQLDSVLGDTRVQAAKTGMLPNRSVVEVVAQKLKEYRIRNLVVDPVMAAGTGEQLIREEDRDSLKRLLPLAEVVTPNLDEAQFLSGLQVQSVEDMKRAAEVIHKQGPDCVLIKGGHLPGDPLDILYDGKDFTEFRGERVPAENAHGTGCVFSAALAAGLARGKKPEEAARMAKTHVTEALKKSLSKDCCRSSTNGSAVPEAAEKREEER